MERACKPNFVSAACAVEGNHSSRPFVAERLERPTQKRCPLFSRTPSGQLGRIVSLFGLAPRGVYPAALVTKRAGGLLPHRFTHNLLTRLVCSLLHLSSPGCPGARTLSGSLPFGVRTFLFSQGEATARLRSIARLEDYSKKC